MHGGQMIRVAALTMALSTVLTGGQAMAGTGDDCPPNAQPGHCYEKVLTPARYESYVVTDASGRYVTSQRQVSGARFEWREIACQGGPVAYNAPYGYTPAFGPNPATRVLTSPDVVRGAQAALGARGYYRGPVTGSDNPATEQALARFQSDNRLERGWTAETLWALGLSYP